MNTGGIQYNLSNNSQGNSQGNLQGNSQGNSYKIQSQQPVFNSPEEACAPLCPPAIKSPSDLPPPKTGGSPSGHSAKSSSASPGSNEAQSRKKTLKLTEFTPCNPSSGGKASSTKCLPPSVYKSIPREAYEQCKTTTKTRKSRGSSDQFIEHCLLDHAKIPQQSKTAIRKKYLRPRYPKEWLKDSDEWLDNFQIQSVLKQYETTNKWFKMLGVFPMDFSAPNPYKKSKNTNNITQKLSLAKCLYPEICLLDLRKEYNRGIRGIGIVFNLDPHYKDGSHWVAMYIRMHTIESPGIYYFDSYGYKTPPLIAKFMRALKLQVPGAHLAYNARRFQYSETECGMYSIYFIVSMMKNISFKHFCKQPVRDPEMIHLRKIVFSK